MGTWDGVIVAGVLLWLGIAVWARISRQTVPELLSQIKDMFTERTEDVKDNVQHMEVYG